LACRLNGLTQMLQDDANLVQKPKAGIGEKYPAAVPFEQPNTQFALQIADVAADRGLRNPEPLRRFSEAEFFRYREERMKLPKIHFLGFLRFVVLYQVSIDTLPDSY